MPPLVPPVLGLSLFGHPVLDVLKMLIVMAVLAVVAYAVFKPGAGMSLNIPDLQANAARLLTFIDGLGFGTVFKPLLTDLAQGNYAAIPAHVIAIFRSVDDKQSRGQMLDAHFYSEAGLDRQLEDPQRRAKLLQVLQQKLDLVVQPKAAAVASPPASS